MNRDYSLKRHKEFRYTYRVGRSQSGSLITVVYARSRSETVRIGFSVSKRVGNAVQRNRAKRRMRAALTPLLPRIPGGYNVIFVAKPDVLSAEFTALSAQMETLLRRAGLWRDEA